MSSDEDGDEDETDDVGDKGVGPLPSVSCDGKDEGALTDGELAPEGLWSGTQSMQQSMDLVKRAVSDLAAPLPRNAACRRRLYPPASERATSATAIRSSSVAGKANQPQLLGARRLLGASTNITQQAAQEELTYREQGFVHRQTFEALPNKRPKPPPGRLVFDGNFEGGNIARARRIDNGAEIEISLRHDFKNEKYRLWFHFNVSNALPGQHVLLTIINFSKSRSLFRYGMTPVVRTLRRPAWYRLPGNHTYYYKSTKHGGHWVLSMAFTFDDADDIYEFAYSFPFSYTALMYELSYIDFLDLTFYRRQLLTQTPQGRRVEVLTISSPMFTCPLTAPWDAHTGEGLASYRSSSDGGWGASPYSTINAGAKSSPQHPCLSRTNSTMASSSGKRRLVFVTSRVHPGETPASYVVQGLINFLTSSNADAALLRSNITFVIIPMLNPDGAFLGNYRCDSNGEDLNRRWGVRLENEEPALHQAVKLLQAYSMNPNFQVDLFIDVHAHSTSRTSFMFCNRPARDLQATGADLAAAADRVTKLPKIMDTCVPGFSYASCAYDDGPTKAGCARRVAGGLLPMAICYTLEISFFHAPPDRVKLSQVEAEALSLSNSIEGYMEMGKQLAISILHYYNLRSCSAASTQAPPRNTYGSMGNTSGSMGTTYGSSGSVGNMGSMGGMGSMGNTYGSSGNMGNSGSMGSMGNTHGNAYGSMGSMASVGILNSDSTLSQVSPQ